MPLTLAQAKAAMTDKVDQLVIDEFRRESSLLDKLTFDDAVSPGTGGSTMTYGYVRLLTPSTASTRKINSEYTPNEAVRKNAPRTSRFLAARSPSTALFRRPAEISTKLSSSSRTRSRRLGTISIILSSMEIL